MTVVKNQHITISKAKPEDARGMETVRYIAWLDTYPNKKYNITAEDIKYRFKDKFTKEGIKKKQDQIRNQKKNQLLLVAKLHSKIVGLCGAVKNPDVNQLTVIYILPKYQRMGIGQMFWKRILAFFGKNNKRTIVHVAAYNEKAINFYKKLGFVKTRKKLKSDMHAMRNGAMMPEIEMVLRPNRIIKSRLISKSKWILKRKN